MKRSVLVIMMVVIVVCFESGMPLQNNIVKQDAPTSGSQDSREMADLSRSLVSGAVEFTGPTYIYSNVEYTYTFEIRDVNVDHVVPDIQILDPNTTATLTRVGSVTLKFICSGPGAYYIQAKGYTSSNTYYSFDSYPIICLY